MQARMRTIFDLLLVLALGLLSVTCRADRPHSPREEPDLAPIAGGLPLPADAIEQTGIAPRGVEMSVFHVPRSRDAVSAELRASLAADGWTIDAEELSPTHRALRWELMKADAKLDVRITGDDNDAAIIVTQP